MKKNYVYALMSAIALTGAMGLTSCSEEEMVDVNPTYDSVEKTVTTRFVLNIASDEMASTRQSATTVQKNNNFRGMQNAKLIGLSTGKTYDSEHPTFWLAPFSGSSTGYSVIKSYDLGTLYANGSINNTGAEDPTAANPTNSTNRNSSSHRVVELTLPLQTDAMLVYGRAIPAGDNEENGKVVDNVNATPENTTFELVPRLEDSQAYTQTCNLAALILNRIMLSQVAEHGMTSPITRDKDGDDETLDDRYTQQAALPALSWREIGTKTDVQIAALAPLQENLATAYKKIADTYSSTAAIHSGSAVAVCDLIKDVYSIANSVANAVSTNDDELNAQRLADVIKTRIGYYFNISTTPYTFHNLGETGTDGSPKKYLIDNTSLTANDFAANGTYGKVTDPYLQGLPTAFNLPAGVAQLEFVPFDNDGSNGFQYKTLANSHSLIDISNVLNPEKYVYPSELLYFDNSLLRVTDSDKDPGDYPNGYNVWDTDGWSGWTIGKVASTTRSVAVKNNINYGVAMLKTNVEIDNTVSTFKDNHPVEENVTISAAEIQSFKLTGVLIGGQYKQLGWNYLSSGDGTSNANKDFVIYDNKIADQDILNTSNSHTILPNYTLVFDNYADASAQSDVLIALEFKNGNDKDIYGKGGMIPKGGTFYLVGKLEIGSKTIDTWPSTYAIPPYNANGESQTIPRVFVQDYMTTATFKIGEESLKYAYTTVPDLRSSQTSLGLSVDLNWRTGINFESIILGQ